MKTRVFAAAAVALCIMSGWAAGEDAFTELAQSARLALDTGRLAEAEALFRQAEVADKGRLGEIAQDMAWTHIILGAEAVSAKQMAEADAHFAKADCLCGGYRKYLADRWEYARVCLTNESIGAAWTDPHNADMRALVGRVTWLLELNDKNPQAHYMMGQVHELMQQEAKAAAEYKKALEAAHKGAGGKIAVLRKEAQKAAGETIYHWSGLGTNPVWLKSDPGPFQKYSCGKFLVYHHSVPLAKRVVRLLKHNLDLGILDGVITAEDPMPEVLTVYLYANPAEMKGNLEGKFAAAETGRREDGEIVLDTIRVCQTYMNLTQDLLPHELTHVRLAHMKLGKQRPPMWVDEGIAASSESEDSRRRRAKKVLETRKSDSKIAMGRLFTGKRMPLDEESTSFVYAESLAVVQGLVEKYGREKFVLLIWTLKTEEPEKAFADVYGATYEDIEKVMYEWAEKTAAGK